MRVVLRHVNDVYLHRLHVQRFIYHGYLSSEQYNCVLRHESASLLSSININHGVSIHICQNKVCVRPSAHVGSREGTSRLDARFQNTSMPLSMQHTKWQACDTANCIIMESVVHFHAALCAHFQHLDPGQRQTNTIYFRKKGWSPSWFIQCLKSIEYVNHPDK